MKIGNIAGLRTLWGFITGIGLFGYGLVVKVDVVKQVKQERWNDEDVD